MRERCDSPGHAGYADYGGRGITVCERWYNFAALVADMGEPPSPKHTVERIDNDGPYAPDNCCWATQQEQCNNSRRNHRLEHDGQSRTVTEWSRHTGLTVSTIRGRLRLGWSVSDTLTRPLTRKKS
jgi:hypothetical protein